MPELWDLYDIDRQPLNRTIQRGKPMQEGEYHLGVAVAVFNFQGELLLTRRAPGKTFPGVWEIPAGSVQAGETSQQAACRELQEETGVSVIPQELTLLQRQIRPHLHADFYAAIKNVSLEDIVLQPSETDAARWCSLENWIAEQEANASQDPAWHKQFIQPLYQPLLEYQSRKPNFHK